MVKPAICNREIRVRFSAGACLNNIVIDFATFFLGLIVITSAGVLLLKIIQFRKYYKEDISDSDTKKTQEFLGATKVFVRDPSMFKDTDHDGIDDIIDDKK